MRDIAKVILIFMLFSCSTVQPISKNKENHIINSDNSSFDYMNGKFYLKAPEDLDISSREEILALCKEKSIQYVLTKSEGYKVIKSFGTSDDKQILLGTLTCLYNNHWRIFELKKENFTSVNDHEIFNRFLGVK